MSGEDDPQPRLVLECERCGATFEPQRWGYASVRDVPLDACCPRCFSNFVEAEVKPDGDPAGG